MKIDVWIDGDWRVKTRIFNVLSDVNTRQYKRQFYKINLNGYLRIKKQESGVAMPRQSDETPGRTGNSWFLIEREFGIRYYASRDV